jgi:hypothetical protein
LSVYMTTIWKFVGPVVMTILLLEGIGDAIASPVTHVPWAAALGWCIGVLPVLSVIVSFCLLHDESGQSVWSRFRNRRRCEGSGSSGDGGGWGGGWDGGGDGGSDGGGRAPAVAQTRKPRRSGAHHDARRAGVGDAADGRSPLDACEPRSLGRRPLADRRGHLAASGSRRKEEGKLEHAPNAEFNFERRFLLSHEKCLPI